MFFSLFRVKTLRFRLHLFPSLDPPGALRLSRHKRRKAVRKRLAVLIRRVFCEPTSENQSTLHFTISGLWNHLRRSAGRLQECRLADVALDVFRGLVL